MDMTTVLVLAMLVVLQAINLVALNKANGHSVDKAARKAADSVRKNMENKINKFNPWLKGFDPSKVPSNFLNAEPESSDTEDDD